MNVFKLLIGFNLIEGIRLLQDACRCFRLNLVTGMEADRTGSRSTWSDPMLVTALTPEIGYEKACAIAQHAHRDGLTLRGRHAIRSDHRRTV